MKYFKKYFECNKLLERQVFERSGKKSIVRLKAVNLCDKFFDRPNCFQGLGFDALVNSICFEIFGGTHIFLTQ